jgi:hypothetical protein
MKPSADASRMTDPIARRSGVLTSDVASLSSTSAEMSVSRLFAKRLMTARADLRHSGFVGADVDVSGDVSVEGVAERAVDIDVRSSFCGRCRSPMRDL